MSTLPYEIRLLREKIEELRGKYEILLATQVQILGRLKELEDKDKIHVLDDEANDLTRKLGDES